jgi:diacylglycerol kinase (ATP)
MMKAPRPNPRTCVLLNATAGPATDNQPLLDELQSSDFDLRELTPENWDAVLADAVANCDRILIAGGDGTVHAVVDAVLNAKRKPTLGIVPLGTGNDLCRTLAIPFDPAEALRVWLAADMRELDAIRISGDANGHLANAATGGFSGQVAAEVTSEVKSAWGPFAYVRGAVGTLADLPHFPLTLRFDDGPPERIDVLNLVVANARTAAGGVVVAPTADPEDGLLDVVLVKSDDSLDLAVLASRLMSGNYLDDEAVLHRRARRVEVESESPLPLSIDGERCEVRRVAFEVMPRALRIVVGPEYFRTPAPVTAIEDESEDDETPATPRERFFGLAGGLLLVLKSLRNTPWLWLLGIALASSVLLARGVIVDDWREWDAAIHQSMRAGATPESDRFARAVTWFGGAWGSALIVSVAMLALLRMKHYLTAGTLLAAVAGVLAIEAVLKPLFSLTRPELSNPLHDATGYSFPSGHALRGIGIYGTLAMVAAEWAVRRPLWWLGAALCGGLAIGIGWSRVHLGVHWPTDVIMGGLLAAAWVSICLLARQRIQRRREANRITP